MPIVHGHDIDVRFTHPSRQGYSVDEQLVFYDRKAVIYFDGSSQVAVNCMLCAARGYVCTGVQSYVVTVDGEQATQGLNMAFVSVEASGVRGVSCLEHSHEVQDINEFLFSMAQYLGLGGDNVIDGNCW